jgi:hypothetical protein
MKKFILILSVMPILLTCEKKDEKYNDDGIGCSFIYKIKDTSYFNYVPVHVKKDLSKILSVPDKKTQEKWIGKPITLDSSYYYEPILRKTGTERYFAYGGLYTAIIDIRIVDYQDNINSDTMLRHIKSHDLFTDFYTELDTLITSVSTFEHDTALLNSWIRKGELGKYLKRLK